MFYEMYVCVYGYTNKLNFYLNQDVFSVHVYIYIAVPFSVNNGFSK
jgi:hypothetical protein